MLLISCSKNDNDGGITLAKDVYALPFDTLFPEGIAYNPTTGHFYTGSVTSGDLLKVSVQSGEVQTFAMGSLQGRHQIKI